MRGWLLFERGAFPFLGYAWFPFGKGLLWSCRGVTFYIMLLVLLAGVVNFCFLSLFFILFSYCPNYAFEEMKFGHFCLGNTPVET